MEKKINDEVEKIIEENAKCECGAKITLDSKHCSQCGKRVNECIVKSIGDINRMNDKLRNYAIVNISTNLNVNKSLMIMAHVALFSIITDWLCGFTTDEKLMELITASKNVD